MDIVLLYPAAKLPFRATARSAGFDCFPALPEGEIIQLKPGERILVGLGFSMTPPPGMAGFLHPRSGKGNKGLVLGNLTGVIDNDYTGEVKASLWNRTETETFILSRDEAVCQLVVAAYYTGDINVVSKLEETERGDGGFGSTDRK